MLVESRHERIVTQGESLAPTVRETETDARGWSRTHQLLINPLAPEDTPGRCARLSRLNTAPVYALADPAWLYETRALGPLWPRDHERFGEAEDFIAAAFEPYIARGHERDQEYGFVDYFAGPHYRRMGVYRYMTTYAVRPSSWLLYARSGERRLREWAAGSTRTYMDGRMTHWDNPHDPTSRRIRGLYTTKGPVIAMMAPYYWGYGSGPFAGDGQASNIKYLMQYYLTGYRRAGDVLDLYAEGLKEWWRPGIRPFYLIRAMRNIHNAYRHTWDPDLRIMLEDFAGRFYDPESSVFVDKDQWPHRRILYKTPEHMNIPIKIWESLGDGRFYDVAMGWARANMYGCGIQSYCLGLDPMRGRFEKGRTGYFLYQETGQRHLAEEMLLAVQRSIPSRSSTISSINWDIQGIVYGLALIAETDVDRRSVAAWLAYDDAAAEGDVRLFIRKGHYESIRFRSLRVESVEPYRQRSQLRGYVNAGPLRISRGHIVKDAEGGDYELIVGGERGYNFVFSDSRHPLVLYADGPWQPAPLEAVSWPAIYFRVPQNTESPRIHFAGSARLIDPEGKRWRNGAPQSGWVDLPAGRPGMWSFEPVENEPVTVENIPPFFAFRDPAYHFIPDISRR